MMNFLFALVVLAVVFGSQFLILLATKSEFKIGHMLASIVAPLTEEAGRAICPLMGILLGGLEFFGYGYQYAVAEEQLNGSSSKCAAAIGIIGGLKHLAFHLSLTGVLLGLGGGVVGFAVCVSLHAANNFLAVLNMQPPVWLRMAITPIRMAVLAASALVFITIIFLGTYLYFW